MPSVDSSTLVEHDGQLSHLHAVWVAADAASVIVSLTRLDTGRFMAARLTRDLLSHGGMHNDMFVYADEQAVWVECPGIAPFGLPHDWLAEFMGRTYEMAPTRVEWDHESWGLESN